MLPHSSPPRRHAAAGRPFHTLLAATLGLVLAAALAVAPLGAQQSGERERDKDRERDRRKPGARPNPRPRTSAREGVPGPSRMDTTVAMDARGIVELSLNGGDVIVRTWDRAEVRVRAQVESGRLELDAGPTRVVLADAEHSDADARFEVTMPRTARLAIDGTNAEVSVDGVRGGVLLENATGDVRMADVGGLVRAEIVTGDLQVTGGDGEFRLSLASGDVTLRDVAGRIEVENVSGDINVSGSRARELRLETTSGSISYEGTVQAEGTYELSTHSGDVQLRLAEGTRARLEAETYNGEFTSDYPVTMQPGAPRGARQQRRYELLVGGGGGPLIRIESFNGDIHLARAATLRPDSTRTNR